MFHLKSWCLFQRRTVWCPTLLGWFCIVALLMLPVFWWCSCGEVFLSLTHRLPADILVVEGWIGPAGIRAAGVEFEQRGYQYVVGAGGLADERWNEPRWSYAEGAGRELLQFGIAKDRIILAPAGDPERQRTYESAVAVRRALQVRGIQPRALNVFTLGAHARRSQLVFAKVLRTKVGVVDWTPSGYQAVPWWRSSERAKDLLTETAGYLYEALLNAGRSSNSAGEGGSPDVAQHPGEAAQAAVP
jgi:hypothetical protein